MFGQILTEIGMDIALAVCGRLIFRYIRPYWCHTCYALRLRFPWHRVRYEGKQAYVMCRFSGKVIVEPVAKPEPTPV